MKFRFASFIAVVSLLLLSFVFVSAQNGSSNKTDNKTKTDGNKPAAKTVNITPTTKPEELAQIVVDVLGGEKFKNVKTMITSGSVELYAPNSTQSIPGSFIITNSGIKYRMEVKSIQSFSFIHDGERSYSSIPGFEIPSPAKYGIPALQHLGEAGYAIAALPDKKKMRAFSLTGPEGNVTRFFVDTKTGRIKSYEIPYRDLVYGSEVDEYKEYDGILVPTKFVQRLDTQMGAFYAEFKAKEVKLNAIVEDDVFAIPAK
jgi:hypothetical protein